MSRLKKLEKGMWSQDIPVLSQVKAVLLAYFHCSDLYFRTHPEMNQILEDLCRDYRD